MEAPPPQQQPAGSPELLGRAVSRHDVESLHAAGILGSEARRTALEHIRPAREWWLWASRLLLLLAAGLILSGIVFFFAYNWARMDRFLKFTLLEGALLGYDLQMNLAYKSAVLAGTGLVLLAARLVLGTRPWAREAVK